MSRHFRIWTRNVNYHIAIILKDSSLVLYKVLTVIVKKLWIMTSTFGFCMHITIVNGNRSWKFYEDTLTQTLQKGVCQTDKQTDGQTGKAIDRAAWSQLKIKLITAYHFKTFLPLWHDLKRGTFISTIPSCATHSSVKQQGVENNCEKVLHSKAEKANEYMYIELLQKLCMYDECTFNMANMPCWSAH